MGINNMNDHVLIRTSSEYVFDVNLQKVFLLRLTILLPEKDLVVGPAALFL